ncbi:predicted protein [Phaeodactylum tricornutum CCAP 1055/1]|jgi:hypothetical protein|uniref:DUF6824 domain-containing protein n=1 Tax=Phaeodactylum tricornutum (strain CCAP 1055/1) TaxID=556484 RepID=B7FTE8_PHATC|nr:predicted protein [Phaeodactylum tricornutum CCAP 1055/1]EEC50955.1 predicted protein [Phaeodactylum tricornutum CCAP 1055/1]|eukprot:XP_002178141.1 predicted protein [Phaeodactylum tricornutum CCAP 1055/1]
MIEVMPLTSIVSSQAKDGESGKDTRRMPDTTSSASKEFSSAVLSRLFQSNDSTTELLRDQLFKSGDSAEFLSTSLKSEDPFKSGTYVSKLLNSGESKKLPPPFGSFVRTASDILKSTASTVTSRMPDIFASSDWTNKLAPKHVDVDVSSVFQSEQSQRSIGDPDKEREKRKISDIAATALPTPVPSFGSRKTDWDALYQAQLPGSKGVATTLKKQPVASVLEKTPAPLAAVSGPIVTEIQPTVPVSASANNKAKEMSNKRKRNETVERVYTLPTDLDVLMGRGGRTNNHGGNKRYLAKKEEIQQRYMEASKQDKTGISQELVDAVHEWGGRFLKMDESLDRWYEVENIVARKKASQTLREINTPDERASKRAKYASNSPTR